MPMLPSIRYRERLILLCMVASAVSGCMGANEGGTEEACLAKDYLLEFYQKSPLTSDYAKVDTVKGHGFYVSIGAYQNPGSSASGSNKELMCQDHLRNPSLSVDAPIQVTGRGTISANTNLFLDTSLVKAGPPSSSSLVFPAEYRFEAGTRTFSYSATLFGRTVGDTVSLHFTDVPTP